MTTILFVMLKEKDMTLEVIHLFYFFINVIWFVKYFILLLEKITLSNKDFF